MRSISRGNFQFPPMNVRCFFNFLLYNDVINYIFKDLRVRFSLGLIMIFLWCIVVDDRIFPDNDL